MDTMILHGHPGRPTHMLGDDNTRVRADRTIAIRSGYRDVSATSRLDIGLRSTIFVVGYLLGGIALIWLSALISALAAAVLSGIYMVVVTCVIIHMTCTSTTANEHSSVSRSSVSAQRNAVCSGADLATTSRYSRMEDEALRR